MKHKLSVVQPIKLTIFNMGVFISLFISLLPSSKGWVPIIREEGGLACRLGHCFLSKSCKIEISHMVLLSSWFLAKFIR